MNAPALTGSPVLWLAVLGVFSVIVVQSVVYLRAARRAADSAEITRGELTTALRTGAVSAIGPSAAVVFIALTLLTVFGTPAVLVRIGLIGSASFETLAAQTAAGAVGVELGGPGYDDTVFALVLFTMSAGGAAWMVTTLVFTPLLRRTDRKVRALNPAVMAIAPSAGMIGAFCYLGLAETQKSTGHLVAFTAGAGVMLALHALNARLRTRWIKEWSLGISMVAALAVAAAAT
ncbi:DUF5058 family protein [Saccharopolyspora sp. HNM0983]|uniref:DUF5058 family protein n=1 Tax=Saccharopolyspora montiporae TaxID=2781240 RepID=A0A929G062_9PSEU|nr:DUF5058 family protein [Saccharopolyspora sp. HNM0983]MBE9375275.1 DUF5058 family protein [Saccharopolyspora sp. HNM0983]